MGSPRLTTLAAAAVGLSMAMVPGCQRGGVPAPRLLGPEGRAVGHELFGDRSRDDRDAIIVLQMQFDVLRVELPAAPIHHGDKTWNHVEELSADPTQVALLRRNGLRLGIATADAWPALRAIFDAAGATVARATHQVRQGVPLTLDLGPVENEAAVFLLTSDHRLVGQTFDQGSKYLHLDYAPGEEGGNSMAIRMTPEIHRTSANQRWRQVGDELRQVPDYAGAVYQQLAQTVEVAPGEFLVIGPDSSASPLTVGHRFLTRSLGGRLHDTILCITPQPFRTDQLRR